MTYITEKHIQDRYKSNCICKTEVKTPAGRIDVLTSDAVIEIKKSYSWKEGVGQLMVYSFYYPNYRRILHLYDSRYDKSLFGTYRYNTMDLKYTIWQVTQSHSIEVVIEQDNDVVLLDDLIAEYLSQMEILNRELQTTLNLSHCKSI